MVTMVTTMAMDGATMDGDDGDERQWTVTDDDDGDDGDGDGKRTRRWRWTGRQWTATMGTNGDGQ